MLSRAESTSFQQAYRHRLLLRRITKKMWLSKSLMGGLRAESFRCAGPRFGGFFFAVFGRRGGFQGAEQPVRDGGYFIDRSEKSFLIGLRRFVEAGDLSYELQRSSLDFVGGDGRIKVEKRFDVSAHLLILMDGFAVALRRAQAFSRAAII
jgi:hypothetical protein